MTASGLIRPTCTATTNITRSTPRFDSIRRRDAPQAIRPRRFPQRQKPSNQLINKQSSSWHGTC
jgi:hypothetical protein